VTESDWLHSDAPEQMLEWLCHSGMASERKLRLFACASYRRIWDLLSSDARAWRAIEATERYSDGEKSEETTAAAGTGFFMHPPGAPLRSLVWGRLTSWDVDLIRDAKMRMADALRDAGGAIGFAAYATGGADYLSRRVANPEARVQANLLRDIFGNPFCQVTFDPAWRTPTALTLGQRAYDDRHLPAGTLDPVHLATLSDALEQAGAANAVLAHLRSPGLHVRGCFVVDAILTSR